MLRPTARGKAKGSRGGQAGAWSGAAKGGRATPRSGGYQPNMDPFMVPPKRGPGSKRKDRPARACSAACIRLLVALVFIAWALTMVVILVFNDDSEKAAEVMGAWMPAGLRNQAFSRQRMIADEEQKHRMERELAEVRNRAKAQWKAAREAERQAIAAEAQKGETSLMGDSLQTELDSLVGELKATLAELEDARSQHHMSQLQRMDLETKIEAVTAQLAKETAAGEDLEQQLATAEDRRREQLARASRIAEDAVRPGTFVVTRRSGAPANEGEFSWALVADGDSNGGARERETLVTSSAHYLTHSAAVVAARFARLNAMRGDHVRVMPFERPEDATHFVDRYYDEDGHLRFSCVATIVTSTGEALGAARPREDAEDCEADVRSIVRRAEGAEVDGSAAAAGGAAAAEGLMGDDILEIVPPAGDGADDDGRGGGEEDPQDWYHT